MDKIGRDTGVGKVEIDLGDIDDLWPWPIRHALLFNYNSDGNLLKGEHIQFLDDQLIPLLHREKVHVRLTGLASGKGNADYNQTLSLERVLRVKKYLIEKGPLSEAQVPGTKMTAVGETLANPQDENDERDRAVRIAIAPGFLSRPIPVPPLRPTDPLLDFFPWFPFDLPGPESQSLQKKKFWVSYTSGLSVSAGVVAKIPAGPGAGLHGIVIVDPATKKFRRFALPTGESSAGFGIPLGPVSVTASLPSEARLRFTELEFDHESLDDFLFEPTVIAGASALEAGDMTIEFPDQGVKGPINTGTTVGATVGEAAGQLVPVGGQQDLR